MNDQALSFINEEFTRSSVTPAEHDRLLADGWRHFAQQYFRYNLAPYENEIRLVIPLRIRLSDFRLAQSQERVVRKNSDVSASFGPVNVTSEVLRLFESHKRRFSRHPPESIYSFIAESPEAEPCETLQQTLRIGDHLLATGFFDVGERAVSAIYTAFDPNQRQRSLGIFTILKEIEFASNCGKEFFYLGYCYNGSSFYDYKKRFHGTEAYDWNGRWTPLPRDI
ncbi:MAG: arginine-tRNA-protein transferase [Pyrinomonadaceae bacterium]